MSAGPELSRFAITVGGAQLRRVAPYCRFCTAKCRQLCHMEIADDVTPTRIIMRRLCDGQGVFIATMDQGAIQIAEPAAGPAEAEHCQVYMIEDHRPRPVVVAPKRRRKREPNIGQSD